MTAINHHLISLWVCGWVCCLQMSDSERFTFSTNSRWMLPTLYAASHVSHPTLWVLLSVIQGSKLWHGPAEYSQFMPLKKLLGCEKDWESSYNGIMQGRTGKVGEIQVLELASLIFQGLKRKKKHHGKVKNYKEKRNLEY